MLIAIIVLFIIVLILYAKIKGLENALLIHLEEPASEAHPEPDEEDKFEEHY